MNQKGSAYLFLVLIFVSVFLVGGFLVIKTFDAAQKKLTNQSEVLAVVLKDDYSNPLDKKTQYSNPFSSYQNPFDNLK